MNIPLNIPGINTSPKRGDIDPMNPVSYKTIKNTLYNWRRAGGHESDFNELDQPSHLFFKVVFHFWNGDAYGHGDGLENGLLAPTWDWSEGTSSTGNDIGENPVRQEDSNNADITKQRNQVSKDVDDVMKTQNDGGDINIFNQSMLHNSAYNFLIRNDELERAEKLKQFITLLSNISTYSPWYFTEVTGLDGVLERPFKTGETYKIEEKPKQFSIKCMPDAMDNRIATLLDLYRDVAFSHTWHKEILPANLRRFDMSIYIFESPITNLHFESVSKVQGISTPFTDSETSGVMAPVVGSGFPVSYKRIELHDCEIDYNASKSGYTSLNNTDGFQQTFEIPITVGEAFETRYNSFMDREIGDMILIDMVCNTYDNAMINKIFVDAPQVTNDATMAALRKRIDKYRDGSIDLLNVVDDLTGNKITKFVGNVLLGNIYKTSLTDITSNAQLLSRNAMNGNVGGVIDNVKGVFGQKNHKGATGPTGGNISYATGNKPPTQPTSREVKNGWYVSELGNINH